mgnify:CR=1 FL=1
MKKINWILVATFSLMAIALVSCNKDITLREIEQESAGTISVSVDGIMGEYAQGNETKAGLVSTTRVSWSAGDKVYVYDGANCLGELTVSLKDGKDYYAVLTGESIDEPQTDTKKLTLVYSNAITSYPEIIGGKMFLDLSAQEGNTVPKDIPFVAFATIDYTPGTPEISGQIADFSLATSLMRLNCSGLEANTAITESLLTGMSNECVLNITKDGVEIGQGRMGDINVSFSDVSANVRGAQTLYAAVAKNWPASDQTFEIYQVNTYTYSFGSKTRDAGKAFNAICQMEQLFFTVTFDLNGKFGKAPEKLDNISYGSTITKPSDPVVSGYGFYGWYKDEACTEPWNFGSDIVTEDITLYAYWIELPVGVLPGKFSVSATKQVYFSKGNLWADGEKALHFEANQYGFNSSYESSHVSYFTWSNTIESAVSDSNNGDNLFCDEDNKVSVDGSGAIYYALSEEEWLYLFNNHPNKWVTVNGVNGYVIAPDGFAETIADSYADDTALAADNLIFLPAAGTREDSAVFGVGDFCSYWSSSAFDAANAYLMESNEYEISRDWYHRRNFGCSIRLVTDVK